MVRDAGVLVCINGHIPEQFMEIESQGWDVDYYMTALYLFGRTPPEWAKLFEKNPDLAPLQVGQPPTEYNTPTYGGEIAWVRGDPARMLKVVKQVKTPCLCFKILASGNLMANAQPRLQQQTVEARFKYIFENIKSTDGVVVAMWVSKLVVSNASTSVDNSKRRAAARAISICAFSRCSSVTCAAIRWKAWPVNAAAGRHDTRGKHVSRKAVRWHLPAGAQALCTATASTISPSVGPSVGPAKPKA